MNHPKDAAAETQALQAVEQHHANMLGQLKGLVALLMEAVEAGDTEAERTAHATLLDWCDNELIPHALAEEGPLYSGPRDTPEGRLLVEELRTSKGLSGAVAGAAIQRMFAMHLDKENRLLMPFVAGSPELSLAAAVKGLHELTGEGSGHHAETHDGGAHQR